MTKRTITGMRASLGWLVIFALVVRSLIPLGYMPGFAGGGSGPTIVICTGMGPMHMSMEMGGKPGSPEKPLKAQHDAPCPFSVNAVFAFGGFDHPPALPVALLIAFLTLTAVVLSPQRRFGNASSRSPPFLF